MYNVISGNIYASKVSHELYQHVRSGPTFSLICKSLEAYLMMR